MTTPNTFFDILTPAALVTEKADIVFCNSAFQQKFGVRPGQQLMHAMATLFLSSLRNLEKTHELLMDTAKASVTSSFDQAMRLHMSHFMGQDTNQSGLWLLTITAAAKSNTPFAHYMSARNLTPREIDVATLVRDGSQDKDIADQLCISVHTVNQHLKRIHKKFETHARSELVSLLCDAALRKLP